MAEVMLPWMLTGDGDRTVYQVFAETSSLAITGGLS